MPVFNAILVHALLCEDVDTAIFNKDAACKLPDIFSYDFACGEVDDS